MLYLTRKIGESVIIDGTIEITVVEVRGKAIKLGFTFPPDVSVLRREVHERIQAERRGEAEAAHGELATVAADGTPAASDDLASHTVEDKARNEPGL
jgi:carbon storage regulator